MITKGLKITSTNGDFDVDFGDYGDGYKQSYEANYLKSEVYKLERMDGYVCVILRDKEIYLNWQLDLQNIQYLWVEEVSGIAPTSLEDLYDKLKSLR